MMHGIPEQIEDKKADVSRIYRMMGDMMGMMSEMKVEMEKMMKGEHESEE